MYSHREEEIGDDDYKSGYFMTMKDYWNFIKDNRLINGTLSLVNFNRVFNQGAMNQLLLDFDRVHIAKVVEDCKTIDFECAQNVEEDEEEEDEEDKENKPKDEQTTFNTGFDKLVTESNYTKRFLKEEKSPERPMLLRHFVDALVRTIYLKNEGWKNFPYYLNNLLETRIKPVMNEELKPREIIPDSDN